MYRSARLMLSQGFVLVAAAVLLGLPGCAANHANQQQAKITTSTRETIADIAAEGGDSDSARSILAAAAEHDPANAELQLRYADALLNDGRARQAVEVGQRAIARSPHDPDLAVKFGQLELRAGDAAAAANSFQSVAHGNNLAAFNGLGVARVQQGDLPSAESAFRHAVAINPGDFASRNNLALAMVLQDRPDEAIPMLRSLASEPGAPNRVKHNLALAYAQSGDTRQAAQVLTDLVGPAAAVQELASFANLRRDGTASVASRLGAVQRLGDGTSHNVAALPAPPAAQVASGYGAQEAVVPPPAPPLADTGPAVRPAPVTPVTVQAVAPQKLAPADSAATVVASAAPAPMPAAAAAKPAAPPAPSASAPATITPWPTARYAALRAQREASAAARTAAASATPPAAPVQTAATPAPTVAAPPPAPPVLLTSRVVTDPMPQYHAATTAPVVSSAPTLATTSVAPTQAAAPIAGPAAADSEQADSDSEYPTDPHSFGRVRVRIATVPTKTAALALWSNLTGLVPDLLTGRTPVVAKTKGKTRLPWRLGTGGFLNITAAAEFCRQLRERGPNCNVGL